MVKRMSAHKEAANQVPRFKSLEEEAELMWIMERLLEERGAKPRQKESAVWPA
ncbi:MAG: hypothetical protein HY690_11595 [Chloroflexi bacterium]|nr:hypothetical protein [Chloroflexota bacterium]